MTDPRKDEITGRDTTGHEWDGIQELDTPLPRWWLWVFYATIVWAIGYWVLMPAWPPLSGYTKGLLGYSQRALVEKRLAAAEAAQAPFETRDRGAAVRAYQRRCRPARLRHSGWTLGIRRQLLPMPRFRGGAGGKGYPNLNDDDWLWGGRLHDIQKTIRVGIRSTSPDTRQNQMPAFGRDGMLKPEQISDVAQYVLSFSGRADDKAAAARGAKVFADNCVACHGKDAKGNAELGAPNLTDGIWLYGGSKEDILTTLQNGRGGVMPTWQGKLDDATIKELAVYVHALGGGK